MPISCLVHKVMNETVTGRPNCLAAEVGEVIPNSLVFRSVIQELGAMNTREASLRFTNYSLPDSQ